MINAINDDLQKQLRLRSKFDADCRTFAVLDTKRTNHSIGIVLQSTHPKTGLDILLFLGQRHGSGLTHGGGEQERFADGRSRHMCVHLLAISRLRLEVVRQRLPINQPVARDNAGACALSEYVE